MKMQDNIITVTALNTYVKILLEVNEVLTDISIRGEISNFVNHQKTGHYYFTLKDDKCSVKAVMFKWSNQNLAFMPQTGMNVIVSGKISLYERDGTFQIYVERMFPDGIGSIQQAFERLKTKLAQQGLFDENHKKPLPICPEKVGVVTSKTGAALQDIINVISRRFPLTKLIVYGANVQGENAYKEIVKGIKYIDDNNLADVIIVARGGGSAEDLWVFNHEEIALAAYTCKTPLISAIGHEIDFTILDFVADMRAPTPSAAAELAVPDMQNMYKKCNDLCININKSVFNKFNLCYNEYCDLLQNKSLSDVRNFSDTSREKLVLLQEKIKISVENKLKEKILKFNNFAGLSATLNPANVFKRGYCYAMFNKKTLTKNNLPCKGEQLYITGNSYNITCEAIKIDTEN